MNKKVFLVIGIIILIIAVVAGILVFNKKPEDNQSNDVNTTEEKNVSEQENKTEENNEEGEDENMQTEAQKNPIVTMKVKDYGTIKMELYPEYAPNTVANFVKLVKEGFYNGLTFHRIVADFVVQGGDKEGTGSGQESFTIPGEFSVNNYKKNTLKHEKITYTC